MPGILAVILIILSGCSTLVNGAGRLLDGSAGKEKRIGLYRSGGEKGRRETLKALRGKDGVERAVLSLERVPGLELRLAWPPQNGRAELRSLYFLSSGASGWNEFSLELEGSFFLEDRGDVLSLGFSGASEAAPPTALPAALPEAQLTAELVEGKLRHKNVKMSGEGALGALRNRRERILALAGWMRESGAPRRFGDPAEFERYWKPRLFPERVVPWRRPAEWEREQGRGQGRWQREGDLRWNLDYSDRYFPEELRPLRNAGALLRDWEEAAGWIYLEYHWEEIFASLDRIELNKVK
jgi:hypothetical protein